MDEKPNQIEIIIFREEINYDFPKVGTHRHLKLTYTVPYFDSCHTYSYSSVSQEWKIQGQKNDTYACQNDHLGTYMLQSNAQKSDIWCSKNGFDFLN
jgi:hypothetical protein